MLARRGFLFILKEDSAINDWSRRWKTMSDLSENAKTILSSWRHRLKIKRHLTTQVRVLLYNNCNSYKGFSFGFRWDNWVK